MTDFLKTNFDAILRAYAFILFLDRRWAGAVCIFATMWHPNIGLAGLISCIIVIAASRLLRMPHEDTGLHILNALLVGLSLGAFYQLTAQLTVIIAIASLLTLFLTIAVIDIFWRLGRLPVLSIPFIIVAFTTAFATKSYAELTPYLQLKLAIPDISVSWLDMFFSSLGAIFFIPHPIAGLLLFVALILRSRYLALLCVSGYIVGLSFFTWLAGEHIVNTLPWNGFNFCLTAMALGGFFMVPSAASFLVAMLGAAIAALLTTALQNFLFVFGLPVMATPFLVSTLLILFALSKRFQLTEPQLILDEPAVPEINYERARIARVRLGERDSVPLRTPFFGEWQVYQGFNDRYTHTGAWQYALDFFKVHNGKSYKDQGKQLEDYFCFGLPVVSPVYGTVVRSLDKLTDNNPGEVDTSNNWGNFILIRMASGLHVLLAHLKKDSISVSEGDTVEPGTTIAQCGNSGRSPQPHVHLQVQTSATLGAPTHPFHLTSVILNNLTQHCRFQLILRPSTGDCVQNAVADESIKSVLHLPVGRTFKFIINDLKKSTAVQHQLLVELTLLGQFVLRSDSGASVKFIETEDILAFYDRSGKNDPFLDMFLLAFGLTPYSSDASDWKDAMNSCLLPLTSWQRLLVNLVHPLGVAIRSTYHREYNNDTKSWYQTGEHILDSRIVNVKVTTEASIDANNRIGILMKSTGRTLQAQLQDFGQIEDEGIPSWQSNLE